MCSGTSSMFFYLIAENLRLQCSFGAWRWSLYVKGATTTMTKKEKNWERKRVIWWRIWKPKKNICKVPWEKYEEDVRVHDSAANSAAEDMANSAADPMANIERITTLGDHSSSLTNVLTNTADKFCRNHGIGSNKKVEDMMCCPRRPSQHVCVWCSRLTLVILTYMIFCNIFPYLYMSYIRVA